MHLKTPIQAMSSRNGGPVLVRSDIMRGESMRLWMQVSDQKLILKTSTVQLLSMNIAILKTIVLPELPHSFVITDGSGADSEIFCTFMDNRQRNKWLRYLQSFGVPVMDRHSEKLEWQGRQERK